MPATSDQTVVLRDKQLRLVRRSRSALWQVHYKIGSAKKWYRKSSGTGDLSDAKQIAEDLFHEARVLEKRGLAVVSKKFKAIAQVVSTNFKAEVKAGTGKKSYADYYRAIDTYLIPFFGKHNIDNITADLISEFHRWRTEKVGYELKSSTQNNHNAALNAVFDYAIEKKEMTESQRPSLKNTGAAGEARGIFSTDELIELQQFIQKWAQQTDKPKSQMMRELLGLYVAFVACTGVRPGTETKELKWKHIEFIQKPSMRVIHITLPQGKRGTRTLIARNELWPLLDKLRQLQPEFKNLTLEELIAKKTGAHIFRLRDGTMPYNLIHTFADCLTAAGMSKGDKDGKDRSLYSLRHYYATQRILEGVSFGQLANQMGTSTLMIERHYSHLKPLMIAEQLAGEMPDAKTAEAEEIRRYMNASPVRSDVMNLVGAATGIYLPLVEANSKATKELKDALTKAAAKAH
jgi:integrase